MRLLHTGSMYGNNAGSTWSMSKVEELLEAIGSLTVLEAAELKEMIED